jgi:glucose-6-phosphate 1-dehydrogenase
VLKETLRSGIKRIRQKKTGGSIYCEDLLTSATYVQGEFENPMGFVALNELIEREHIERVIYYLATPPHLTLTSSIICMFAAVGWKITTSGHALWLKNLLGRIWFQPEN